MYFFPTTVLVAQDSSSSSSSSIFYFTAETKEGRKEGGIQASRSMASFCKGPMVLRSLVFLYVGRGGQSLLTAAKKGLSREEEEGANGGLTVRLIQEKSCSTLSFTLSNSPSLSLFSPSHSITAYFCTKEERKRERERSQK